MILQNARSTVSHSQLSLEGGMTKAYHTPSDMIRHPQVRVCPLGIIIPFRRVSEQVRSFLGS
jgi:hypothetical protein